MDLGGVYRIDGGSTTCHSCIIVSQRNIQGTEEILSVTRLILRADLEPAKIAGAGSFSRVEFDQGIE